MMFSLIFLVDDCDGETKLQRIHIADTLTGLANRIRNGRTDLRGGSVDDNARQIGVWRIEP